MYINSRRRAFAIVSRPKRDGIGYHKGLLRPDGFVEELGPEGGRCVALAQFSAGMRVDVDEWIAARDFAQLARQQRALRRGDLTYNLFWNNCEHYVRRLLGRAPVSPQIVAGALLLTLAIGIAVNARTK